MTAFPSYAIGTVSVINGSTIVTGSGVIWSGYNARPGDTIVIAGQAAFVDDVTDDNHLVIPEWPGADLTGTSYAIYKSSPLRFAGGDVMLDVQKLVAAWNAIGFFVYVPAGATEPDPSLGEEGQSARQPSTSKEWYKEGGVWNYTGVYANISFSEDPWSSETAYGARTVLPHSGKLWIARRNNTGVEPGTSAADWGVFYPFPTQSSVTVFLDSGGSEIADGKVLDLPVGVASIIRRVTLRADGVGDIIIDIRKKAFASGLPGPGDSICGSSKPTLSAARDYLDSALTGWAKELSDTDALQFVVESCSGLTSVSVTLHTDRIFT
jgi:hypothetical protein